MPTERLLGAVSRGLKSALSVLWLLTKVMVPVTIAVTFLDRSGVLPRVARAFAPAMGWLGLPGEAAVALVVGNLSSMYAGVGAMAALQLTAKEKLILGAMLMLSHSLPQEGAIVAQAGGRAAAVVGVRLLTAGVTGLMLNLLL
ncbi:MAG: hypothetical protein PWQ41_972 [Bacillota bacterium]|nr:hypothetical protein [Bacillota bacterium]MDK2855054.1 hypothetical protein [Bacillota bacterium]MDK2925198.1 hypothetical protein [Bacillota bacterium]